MKQLLIISCLAVGLLGLATAASASEVTGTISTGIETGISGTVVAVPTASVAPGTYTSDQDVALSAPGASSIYYTFDGSVPTCGDSLKYQVSIPVTASKTIKALSCYANNVFSNVVSFAYAINKTTPPVTPPNPPSGGGGGGGGGGGSVTPPVTPTTTVTGDINGSGKVDKYDFALMMANWGATGTNLSDLNKDGKVDKYDFALMMANWSN